MAREVETLRAALERLVEAVDLAPAPTDERYWLEGKAHRAWQRARAALASDAGSVGALDVVKRVRQAFVDFWSDESIKNDYAFHPSLAFRILDEVAAAYADAERQGEPRSFVGASGIDLPDSLDFDASYRERDAERQGES